MEKVGVPVALEISLDNIYVDILIPKEIYGK
jgi:hypothetical protein